MPRSSLCDADKVAKAVSILTRAPTLSVREAMLAAEFPASEASTKSMQRKVARSLPGKSKGGMKTNNLQRPPPVSSVHLDNTVSELSDLTNVLSTNGNFSPSPPRKMKKQRLNSQQAQDKRESDLYMKSRRSKAHKAATLLYDKERNKENGLSVREVERVIKKASRFRTKFSNNLPQCRLRWPSRTIPS